jgi:hypothetical protein
MSPDGDIDARLQVEGRLLAERGTTVAATDRAFAQLHAAPADVITLAPSRTSRARAASAAAAVLVVLAGGAALIAAGSGDDDRHAVTASTPAYETAAGSAPVDDATPTLPSSPPSAPASSATPDTSVTPGATPDASVTPTAPEPGTPLRPCTYTDPAARPISVSRALSCADGTNVWVTGTVVTAADGTTYLCGNVASDEPSECDGPGLLLVGGRGAADTAMAGPAGGLVGVKRGSELVVAARVGPSGPAPADGPPPFGPPLPPESTLPG